ncbi:MAG: sodium/proline symporter PutP [Clostridia bacterium]|nr:sodium/proline symporter PutP [Clostridia bacterium]
MNWEVLAFVLYFVAMLGIGVWFFAKSKSNSEKDYFLGGRAMGPWVTAMSAQASDMSAWLLMGLPGSILAFGLGQAWIGIGLALGTIANWIIVAKRLRKFSKAAGDSITLPQYLTNRFMAKSPALKIICAVVFLVSFTIYVASAFSAGTKVFTQLFPALDSTVAMIIFAAIILIYTFLGGYKAVCWTDFFQGLLMLVAVLAVPIVIVWFGNTDSALLSEVVKGTDGTEYKFIGDFFAADWKEIVSGLAWGLGYFGMPHIIVRFMAIEKPSMIKKSTIVATVWIILALGATIAIAYFGRMFMVDGESFAAGLLADGAQEMVFVRLSRILFPGLIAGILLAAIIAASMSTADSQLLVASSSFTSDIYKPLIRKQASAKELLWVGRIVVIIVAIVAFFIASSKGEAAAAIMDLVSNAWALFGAAFGPVILLSLFWKRFTYKGAIAGIVAGSVVDIFWLMADKIRITFDSATTYVIDTTAIYELLPGFIAAFIAAVIVTLIDQKPSREVEAIFERATDPSNDD